MITVIDYGLGNLRSVSKALESLGASVNITNDKEKISKAKGVVLPGVGAFYHGMKNLEDLGLIPVIKDIIKERKPFLGICLGLQLLFSETEEHGTHKGLNIIKGKVIKFPNTVKIPHMGWNQCRVTSCDELRSRFFNNIPDNSYFYFVHSYYVVPQDQNVIAATTNYGIKFCSAVTKDNIFGVQFHPEKSSSLGLKFLENFVNYVSK